MKRAVRTLRDSVVLVALVLPVAVAAPADASAARDLIYQPYGRWNGKKIYLSPARHLQPPRARGECGPLSEDRMAFHTAYRATNGVYFNDRYAPRSPYRNLRARHYRVRIGRGTVASAIRNSNAWGATRHIPIHSNAHAFNDCGNTNASRFGTHGIYLRGSTRGRDLAQKLVHTIGIASYRGLRRSPGTNDLVCYIPFDPQGCTRFTRLGELNDTRAPAAYMEVEFHTWQRGYNWVETSRPWAWRFGWGIDWHLRWPR
jgi:hypothetical protein